MDTYFLALTIIASICIFCQLMLALYSHKRLSSAQRLFRYNLSGRVSGAELIEKYARIYRPIPVAVNAEIHGIASSQGDRLAVNRGHVYQKDLYTNIIISIAIALTHKKFHGLQTNRLHELFYILQVALLLLAIVNVNWLMLITCIGLTLILVTSAFYRQASFSFVNNQVLDFAVDLLNLDKNERDLATSLLYIQNGVVHTYPLTALHGLVKFFLP